MSSLLTDSKQQANKYNKMNRILFPIETKDDGNAGEKSMKWKGLDPLEMATRIAALAQEQEVPPKGRTLRENRNLPPLNIDTTFLASETPELPELTMQMDKLTVAIFDDTETKYKMSKAKSIQSTDSKFTKFLPAAAESEKKLKANNTRSRAGKKKRAVDFTSPNYDDSMKNHNVAKSETMIDPWDMSFMSRHNPDRFAVKFSKQQFTMLAAELEALECFQECIPSYKMIQKYLFIGSEAISKSNEQSLYVKSHKFYRLYTTIIQQMSALIEMGEKIYTEKKVAKVTENDASSKKANKKRANKSSKVNSSSSLRVVEHTKEGFTKYMNQWLRENWTNPYPDDDDLLDIARATGTSPTTANNWLINARTRKWRPANIKAYESERPADSLLQDAINVFDGKSIDTGKPNIIKP